MMSVQSLFSRAFLIATIERAIRSFAASLGLAAHGGGHGHPRHRLGREALRRGHGALVTVLLAIGGGTFGKGDGPSFIGEERLAPGRHSGSPGRGVGRAGRRLMALSPAGSPRRRCPPGR